MLAGFLTLFSFRIPSHPSNSRTVDLAVAKILTKITAAGTVSELH